jgi:flagellar M-ring protein FliF
LADLETTIAERIVDTLAPVIGAEHIKSSVTIEYNPNSGDTTQELYDPNMTAILTSQTSEDQTSGAAPIGIPGTTSNVPSAPPAPPAPNSPAANTPAAIAAAAQQASASAGSAQQKSSSVSQGMRSDSKTFAVSRTVHHTLEPAGQIKHLSAAVLIDDFVDVKTVGGKPQETRRKRTPEEMKQLEELVRAAIGFSAQRGDELSFQNVSFQIPPADVPATPTAMQRFLRLIQPWMGLLRYAGLGALFLLIYALVLRPVKNQVLATLRALPAKSQAGLPAADGKDTAKKATTVAEMEGELQKELSESNSEVMRAVVLKRHLVEKVKKEPENATRLIQGWVRQGASGG